MKRYILTCIQEKFHEVWTQTYAQTGNKYKMAGGTLEQPTNEIISTASRIHNAQSLQEPYKKYHGGPSILWKMLPERSICL